MPAKPESVPSEPPAYRAPTPTRTPPDDAHALVVGATGITGSALIDELVAAGWRTTGLSRRPLDLPGAAHVAADLTSLDSLQNALADLRPTHVFITAWSRQETEAENVRVNGGMVRDLLAVLGPQGSLRHVTLVTGFKHYLGPFEAYGIGVLPDTPFLEDAERRPVENFYYAQEDELTAAAAAQGFSWSVHRASTVFGHVVGNAMNMASTLGAYAAIVKATDRPFLFPGSQTAWNGVVDITDAELLADHQLWAATTPQAANTEFNIVDGDLIRWRRLWPQLADYFGVRAESPGETPVPLEEQMVGAEAVWEKLVAQHDLIEPDLSRVASWWHTDSDLGRESEVFGDMTRSRVAGFTGWVNTTGSLLDMLGRYRTDRILP